MKKILFLFIFLFSVQLSIAQTLKAYEKAGDEAMMMQNYFAAYSYYAEGITIDTSIQRLKYKFANAAYLWQSYEEANETFQSIDNNAVSKQFPNFEYEWALTKMSLGLYDEAIVLLKRFLKKGGIPQINRKKAKNKLQSCLNANTILKNPVDVKIIHLDKNINTVYSEFAPIEKDSILYFSALKFKLKSKGKETYITKILFSENQQKGRLAKYGINDKTMHTANPSFSFDGKWVYFTRCENVKEGGIRCKIYRRDLTERRPKDELLPETINLEGYTATHPSIAFDTIRQEEILFFISDRTGGKGGLDIWMSKINKNGKFSKPKNLGRTINTVGNEISPFFHHQQQKLYFSSDYHIGLGGYDVFETQKANNVWKQPSNLSSPINSSLNEQYYTLNPKGNKGYFSSNRIGSMTLTKSACCYDIYSFEYPQKQNKVPTVTLIDTLITHTNESTKDTTDIVKVLTKEEKNQKETQEFEDQLAKMLPIALFFDNDQPNPRTRQRTTRLSYDETYFVYYKKKDEFANQYSKNLPSPEKIKSKNDVYDFFDFKVKAGFDKLNLVSSLLKIELEKGRVLKIYIKGYTSPRASSDYNKILSQRRIHSVKNYIERYEGGIFQQFLDNGQLQIVEVPFGETTSSSHISDDLKDRRNSVYSPLASQERRVEIIEIK